MSTSTELSRKVNRAYDKIRLTGSGLSVRQRVAAWLLHLQENRSDRSDLVTIVLTHERIAQLWEYPERVLREQSRALDDVD